MKMFELIIQGSIEMVCKEETLKGIYVNAL